MALTARASSRVLVFTACGVALAAAVEPATAPPSASVNQHLGVLARNLEAAVARVSPSAQILTGQTDATQALHVTGVGVVFLLPARALPLPRRLPSVRARVREQQELQLEMQQARAATEPGAPPQAPLVTLTIVPTPEPPPLRTPQAAPGALTLEQLERELDREMAARAQLMSQLERIRITQNARLQRALELEMLVLHEQAELFLSQVEQVRQFKEQQVLSQLGLPDRPRPEVSPPDAAPPATGGPSAAEAQWQLWLGSVAPETGKASQVLVSQVQDAIVAALEANGGELGTLDPQEGVMVAVDFVGSGSLGLRTRVLCTLVLRVPAGDVAARAAGTLSAGEFRGRVVARPYLLR